MPEPSAAVMLLAGLALVVRRRHGGGLLRYKTG
ncbi:PEP-CTERM sorting domain-containing protein [Massilia oculi]